MIHYSRVLFGVFFRPTIYGFMFYSSIWLSMFFTCIDAVNLLCIAKNWLGFNLKKKKKLLKAFLIVS